MATVSITLYVFLWVAFNKNMDNLEYGYVFFIYVFPMLFNWIPFTADAFGQAGAWCWIRNEDIYTCEEIVAGQVLPFVLWYVLLYVILSILIVLYAILEYWSRFIATIHTSGDGTKHKKITTNKRKSPDKSGHCYGTFNLHPNQCSPLINRINGLVEPNNPKLVIWIFTAILLPIQGGYIALAYTLLDPDTRKKLKPARFKAAIKDFCQRIEKDSVVMEYPVKHLESSNSMVASVLCSG